MCDPKRWCEAAFVVGKAWRRRGWSVRGNATRQRANGRMMWAGLLMGKTEQPPSLAPPALCTPHLPCTPQPPTLPCSAAEKAGLSLGKIESLGLLSTAERLGLLTIAEDLLTTEPGKISSGGPLACLPACLDVLALYWRTMGARELCAG